MAVNLSNSDIERMNSKSLETLIHQNNYRSQSKELRSLNHSQHLSQQDEPTSMITHNGQNQAFINFIVTYPIISASYFFYPPADMKIGRYIATRTVATIPPRKTIMNGSISLVILLTRLFTSSSNTSATFSSIWST